MAPHHTMSIRAPGSAGQAFDVRGVGTKGGRAGTLVVPVEMGSLSFSLSLSLLFLSLFLSLSLRCGERAWTLVVPMRMGWPRVWRRAMSPMTAFHLPCEGGVRECLSS